MLLFKTKLNQTSGFVCVILAFRLLTVVLGQSWDHLAGDKDKAARARIAF